MADFTFAVDDWCDLDGVIFDFDARATEILGEDPREFEDREGSDLFWKALRDSGDFFLKLELMPGAEELMRYYADAGITPWFLSGVPSQIPEGHYQKQQAVKNRFGDKQPIVTTQSKHKSNFCRPGARIVDDWPKHVDAWTSKGGLWILHTSAASSIEQHRVLRQQQGS